MEDQPRHTLADIVRRVAPIPRPAQTEETQEIESSQMRNPFSRYRGTNPGNIEPNDSSNQPSRSRSVEDTELPERRDNGNVLCLLCLVPGNNSD